MELLQKTKVTIEKGKVAKEEKIGNPKPIADSAAEINVGTGKMNINDALIRTKEKGGSKVLNVWVEASEEEKKEWNKLSKATPKKAQNK